MLAAQFGPALHVQHPFLPASITIDKPESEPTRTPLRRGVHFQPAEGGEYSTGADNIPWMKSEVNLREGA